MRLKFLFFSVITIFCSTSFITAQIPTTGLVGYYPFNGNANDESGNGNNGTDYGAILTTDRCGKSDSAYYFNGSNSYIQISGSNLNFNQYTYSLWGYLSSILSDGDRGTLLSIGSPTADQYINYNRNFVGYNGWACGGYNIGAGQFGMAQGPAPNLFQWYHLAVTRNSNKMKFYVNGLLVAVDSLSYMTFPNYGNGNIYASIGQRYNNTLPFNGKIDDVRIYNRALTDSEILLLYNENCNYSLPDSGTIIGPGDVCRGQNDVPYNVVNMNSIISYAWSYSGTGVTINGNSDSIQLDFANNATSGNLKVLGYKTTGNEIDSSTILITVNSCTLVCDSNLREGLVAYFPFNGNANDESGNGNNGIVYGATLTTDRFGKENSAYSFDGTDDYIEIPKFISIPIGNQPRTVALWIYTLQDSWNVDSHTVFAYGDASPYQTFGIDMHYYPQIQFYTWDHDIYCNTNAPKEGWLFLTFTHDKNTIRAYVNGNLMDSLDIVLQTTLTNIFIGLADVPSNEYYLGKIDDVRIYNRVLTECEVSSLYYTNDNNPNSSYIIGDSVVCQGQKNVSYNVENMDSIISYVWSYSGIGATIIGSSDNILINFTNNATNGNLIVLGTKMSGSGIVSASLFINVNKLPSDAGIIDGDDKVCLNQNGVSYSTLPIDNASNYIWAYSGSGANIIGNTDNIIINFAQNATNGDLIVSGNNKCGNGVASSQFPITVNSCEVPSDNINIPNAFSPNGDDKNQTFVIKGLTENSKLLIFNGSGKKIYESDNYQNDWNGIDSKGNSLASDTYWYVLTIPGIPTEFKGFVYLKR